jgi:hypothetical protein
MRGSMRRLGCYGETAACRANRVGRNVRSVRLPGLSRKETSASGDSKVKDVGLRAVRSLRSHSRGTKRRFEQRSLLCHLQSTCRGYCEVRRDADGEVSTPSRNADFRRSLVM